MPAAPASSSSVVVVVVLVADAVVVAVALRVRPQLRLLAAVRWTEPCMSAMPKSSAAQVLVRDDDA